MNLRTVFHLLQTDIRRLRWLIAITLLLLGVDFVLAIIEGDWYFISHRDSGMGGGKTAYGKDWFDPIYLGGVTAALLAGAAGWNGLAWSRTRPVRPGEAMAAKCLFLLGFLILPQMLMVFLAHVRHHLPAGEAMFTTLAAAGVFVPLWITMAALGRLAGSGLAFCAGLALIALLAGIGMLFDPKMFTLFPAFGDPWGQYAGPHSWCLLGASALSLLAMVYLVAKRWSRPVRLITAAVIVAAFGWQWRTLDFFRITGGMEDTAEVPKPQLDALQPVIQAGGFGGAESMESGQRTVTLTGSFLSTSLPPGVFAFWQPSGDARLRRDGRIVAEAASRHVVKDRPQLNWLYPPPQSPAAEEALAAALPAGARLEKSPAGGLLFGFSPNPGVLGQFKPLQPGTEFDAIPVELEIDLTAVLFRYDTLIDSPLNQVARSTFGAIHLQVREWPGRKGMLEMSAQCPATGLSDDPLTTTWMLSPFAAWRVFLFLPSTGRLLPAEEVQSSREPILGGAAMHRQLLTFDNCGTGDRSRPSVPDEARVLVLAPKLLGSVTRKFTAPPVVAAFPQYTENDLQASGSPYNESLLFLPLGDPRRPDPDKATRAEFGEWLAINRSVPFGKLSVQEFRRWLPRHLDTVLRIRPGNPDYESASLSAVSEGVADPDKTRIIAKLPEFPWLARVIHRRGWEKDARRELLELFNSGASMGLAGQLGIARLEEPETFDRLLGFLESSGRRDLYEALRHLPGIEPRLTESVRRYFERIRQQRGDPSGAGQYFWKLDLPVRHGLPEALSEFLAEFRMQNPALSPKYSSGNDFLSGECLRVFIAPPGIKPRSREACEFLASLKAEDCRFDPLTRRWITPGALP